MQVLNVRWVGIPTDRYGELVTFLRDVLGLETSFAEAATAELETAEGDRVQVFAPGHPYYAFFREHGRGPVPLLEVDDVHAARRELEAAGVEVIGATERDSAWEWIHVRAPDGTLFELAGRLGGDA